MSPRHTPTKTEVAFVTAILAGTIGFGAAPAQAAPEAESPSSLQAVAADVEYTSLMLTAVKLAVESEAADRSTFRVILTSAEGPVANTEVKFLFGASSVTSTTDSAGAAIVTFSNLMIGTYFPISAEFSDRSTATTNIFFAGKSTVAPLVVPAPGQVADGTGFGVPGPAFLVQMLLPPLVTTTPPTGTLTFSLDGVPVRTTPLLDTTNSAVPFYAIPVTSGGTKLLSVHYSGDSNYSAFDFAGLPITVARGLSISATPSALIAYQSGTPVTIRVFDDFGDPYDGTADIKLSGTSVVQGLEIVDGVGTFNSNLLTGLGSNNLIVTFTSNDTPAAVSTQTVAVSVAQAATTLDVSGAFTEVKANQKYSVSVSAGSGAEPISAGRVEVFQAASSSTSAESLPAGAVLLASNSLTSASAGKAIVAVSPKADAGYYLYFRYTDAAGNYKASSKSVKFSAYVPLTTITTTIDGTATVGSTLTAKTTTNVAATSTTYQWYANGTAISGATKSTFKVTTAQVGKSLTVKATATNGTETVSATSAKTTVVPAARVPLTTATTSISGTAKIGSTLTAKTSTNVAATSVKYQWYANSTAITGATKSTFKVTTAQVGKSLTVKATATNGTETVSATSAKTAVVPKSNATLKIKATAKTVKLSKKVTLKVTLTAKNVSSAKGKIKVKVGKTTLTKSVSKPGTYTFTVKASKLGKGKKTFTATYAPSSATAKYVTAPKKVTTKVTIK